MQTVKFWHATTGRIWRVKCRDHDNCEARKVKYPTVAMAEAHMLALGYTRKKPAKARENALPASRAGLLPV